MAESPPSLPAVVGGTPQLNFDALNVRTAALEGGKGIAAGSVSDEKLAKPVIVGAVAGLGTVLAGSGFAVKRTALGTYEITLTVELSTVGILVATQIGGALPAVMIVGTPTKKIFGLEAYKASSAALEKVDTAFTFHVKAS